MIGYDEDLRPAILVGNSTERRIATELNRLRALNRKLVEAGRAMQTALQDVEICGSDWQLDAFDSADVALRAAIEENGDGK